MTIENIVNVILQGKDERQISGFLQFCKEVLWTKYNNYLMDKILIIENEVNKWKFNLPNAKEGYAYEQTYHIPTVEIIPNVTVEIQSVVGLSEKLQGLSIIVSNDKQSFTISGTPTLDTFRKDGATPESNFELTLSYTLNGMVLPDNCKSLERKIPFIINQDPRKLWKNLSVDWDNMPEPKYKKEDTQCEYIKVRANADGIPQKDIVAASKRGRSHAQEAKPRDDHFRIEYLPNDWYILTVADGAGSAKYSRKGSQIACDTAVDFCRQSLLNNSPFEDAIAEYYAQRGGSDGDARKKVGDYIYSIVGSAAFRAHKAIEAEAASHNIPMKQYATTLLLSVCKHFSFGWFIASFWVGDGAICLYNKDEHSAKILGIPDEGEYAGQTRFLTMQDIFHDAATLYQRLRFNIMDDFTALFLMSDGVSDPKFETDANLNNPDKWDALWNDLRDNGVQLTDDNEDSKDQLLNWLDFWAAGNHDDRTIVILYGDNQEVTNADLNSTTANSEEALEPNSDSIEHSEVEVVLDAEFALDEYNNKERQQTE